MTNGRHEVSSPPAEQLSEPLLMGTLVSLQTGRRLHPFPGIPGSQVSNGVNDTYDLLVLWALFNSLGRHIANSGRHERARPIVRLPEYRRDWIQLAASTSSDRAYRLGLSLGGISGMLAHRGPNLCVLYWIILPLYRPRQSLLADGDPRPS